MHFYVCRHRCESSTVIFFFDIAPFPALEDKSFQLLIMKIKNCELSRINEEGAINPKITMK